MSIARLLRRFRHASKCSGDFYTEYGDYLTTTAKKWLCFEKVEEQRTAEPNLASHLDQALEKIVVDQLM